MQNEESNWIDSFILYHAAPVFIVLKTVSAGLVMPAQRN
jgi:hypothetical protein